MSYTGKLLSLSIAQPRSHNSMTQVQSEGFVVPKSSLTNIVKFGEQLLNNQKITSVTTEQLQSNIVIKTTLPTDSALKSYFEIADNFFNDIIVCMWHGGHYIFIMIYNVCPTLISVLVLHENQWNPLLIDHSEDTDDHFYYHR